MSEQRNQNQNQNNQNQNQNQNEQITPGNIKGKIDINDKRERKDGPGGN